MAITSLQIIGSRQLGGADRFFIRLAEALNTSGDTAIAIPRPGSPIAQTLDCRVIQQPVAMANQWDLWSVWRIRQLLKRWRPLVVQTYMGRATRLTRVPRNSDTVHIARLGGYYKLPGYYLHADAWVGNTQGVCDYLVRGGLPADRVFLIGNFVPPKITHDCATIAKVRKNLAIPAEAIVVFSMGRFVSGKGFETLLAAFAAMPSEHNARRLFLLLAGDGPQRSSLKTLARKLGIESRIVWLGWVDEPSVYFQIADCFVCPSDHETLGNVILEAWNNDCVVISTETLGGKELIQSNENGRLTPCGDPQSMAWAIVDLLKASHDERCRLVHNARTLIESRFSPSSIVSAYQQLYREIKKR